MIAYPVPKGKVGMGEREKKERKKEGGRRRGREGREIERRLQMEGGLPGLYLCCSDFHLVVTLLRDQGNLELAGWGLFSPQVSLG